MKDVHQYLEVFKNIVQKEVLNEVSASAMASQFADGSDSITDTNADSIENIVNKNSSSFEGLEGKPLDDIINKFKAISRGESFKTFFNFFKEIKIEIEKIINNNKQLINNISIDEFDKILDELVIKYSSTRASGLEGQTLSIPNAALEIKNIIQDKILEINNIPTEFRPTKNEVGSFNDTTKKFTEEFLKRLSGDLEKLAEKIKALPIESNEKIKNEKIKYDLLKPIYDLLKSLYITIPKMGSFHEACQKLSFAITLRIRLNQIYEGGQDYTEYFANMFEPNKKIKLTATRLSRSDMDEAVNGYLRFIKKSDIDKSQNNIDIDINNKKDNKKSKKKRMVKALQFTLPAFKSKTGAKVCNGAGACAAYCYAAAGTYQYPLGTFKSEFSLMFSLSREFVPNLIKYLRGLPKNVFYIFRIHDSGDFYSPKYFKKWVFIAKRLPGMIFYGYTKQPAYLSMETPPNFKFTQSFGGRNDKILEKLLKIKYKFSKEGVYSDKEKEVIINFLNLNADKKLTLEDWDDRILEKILNIKSKLNKDGAYTDKEKKTIIRYLNLNAKTKLKLEDLDDKNLKKLLNIKYKLNKDGTYTEEQKKIIIRYLNSNSNAKRKLGLKDWDEENFKRILSKLTISKVFMSDEEGGDYQAERKANPGITWIKVVDDDIAALDVGIGPNPPIGIALFVHGQNSGKFKPKSK